MKLMARWTVAALVAVPVVFAVLPAQALDAFQYKAQGHGRYLHSNGTPVRGGYGYGYGRRWHRWHHWHRWNHRRYYR